MDTDEIVMSQVFPAPAPAEESLNETDFGESSTSATSSTARDEFVDKETQDRAKRLEYLLKQTEIYSHFITKKSADSAKKQLPPKKRKAPKGQRNNNKKRKDENENECADNALATVEDSSPKEQLLYPFDSSPNYIKNGEMRRYQIIGLNWMISLYDQGINGILADEMGLGKTLQTISILGYLKHYKKVKGFYLVIVPLTTLANWMEEFEKWCPSLRVVKLGGAKLERKRFIKDVLYTGGWDVCVTSYEICRIEITSLKKFVWHYIVIDEAHRIKNEQTLLAGAVRVLKSSNRLLLTGTPLQNNLHELWALLNFLLPDVFNSADDFDDWFDTRECLDNAVLVGRLQAVVKPFMLRRLKATAEPNLKPKQDVNIFVGLSKLQREWYKKVLLRYISYIDNKGYVVKKRLQNIWMQLRKAANHPYLFDGAEIGPPYEEGEHLVMNSSKMVILDKLLKKLKAQGSRVLIFSQMTRVLDIIEDFCNLRQYEYCRLDGSVKTDERQIRMHEFNAKNSKKFIFMMTTRAGGLGINLATADVVIIFDIDCNPQADLQAEDRCHRIGQNKQVRVFRLITENSIEQRILKRCEEKLQLDQMVMQRNSSYQISHEAMIQIMRANAEELLAADDLELTNKYYDDIIRRALL